MAPCWGLVGCTVDHSDVQVVTLESVDIVLTVRGFVARVNACLTYRNDSDKPLEVEYQMPVDEGAAVYSFEAVVNGRKITAQCMEKKKAVNIYKDAVKKGHTAVLGREDDLTSDVFHLALGNLPAGTKAELKLGMVMELKVKTDGAVNFTLPAVLNPRYCPADISADQHTQSVTQHDKITVIVSKVYTFNIQAKVMGGHEISRIISHTDALNITLSDDAFSAQVTQDGGFKPDHDWSMLLYYSNPYKSHILCETGDRTATGIMRDDLIMINVHPEIPDESYSNKNEIIFIVDRSGSMQGEKMQSARATLLLFLKSLPSDCYFNILSFGSNHSLLFPKGSEKYTEKTLQRACILHGQMSADMGGTEILQPLKEIYSSPPKPGYARQVLLLTDGQVFNVDQVNQLVSRHADETRVFAVGIGHGASTALINGMARAGRGRSEMVYQQDKLQLKVMGLVKSMLQECVQDVKINFEVDPPGGIKLVPKVPPVIFGGQHLVVYTRVPPSSDIKNITIKGVVGNKEFSTGLVGSDIIKVHDEEKTLHRLAARAQINQWQIDEEEDVAEDMIALSIASGVVSRRTALVGVDQDSTPLLPAPTVQSKMVHAPMINSPRPLASPVSGFVNRASPQQRGFNFGSSPSKMKRASVMNSPRSLASPVSSFVNRASPQQRCFSSGSSQDMVWDMMPTTEGYGFASVDDSSSSDEMEQDERKEEDTLMTAVNLQKFNGSWSLDDAAKLTAVPSQRLKDASTTQNETSWATAVVLAFLEMKYSSEKDQWILLANKARLFISSCGDNAEALVTSARKVLA